MPQNTDFKLIYPHSIQPGGFRWAGQFMNNDLLYPKKLTTARPAWVSYRADDRGVLWVKTTIAAGETLWVSKSSGTAARDRCGNAVADSPPPGARIVQHTSLFPASGLEVPDVQWVTPPDIVFSLKETGAMPFLPGSLLGSQPGDGYDLPALRLHSLLPALISVTEGEAAVGATADSVVAPGQNWMGGGGGIYTSTAALANKGRSGTGRNGDAVVAPEPSSCLAMALSGLFLLTLSRLRRGRRLRR